MKEGMPKRIRPGGPVKFDKPFEVQGKFYDPEMPPKILHGENGEEIAQGGKEISKDEAYNMMFWSHWDDFYTAEKKRDMAIQINTAVKDGKIYNFVEVTKTDDNFEIEQHDKEKLSALRIMAREMGYEIGPYKVNENAGNVEAEIKKIEHTQ